MSIVNTKNLERLLQTNWTTFIDQARFLKQVIIDARNGNYACLPATHELRKQTSVTITRFAVLSNGNFEILVEFALQQNNDMVIGTHIYHLCLDGALVLKETSGNLLTEHQPL